MMNGKGDIQRPTDKKKFDDNYDKIFRKDKLANDKIPPNKSTEPTELQTSKENKI
jgi:hypothetical protein